MTFDDMVDDAIFNLLVQGKKSMSRDRSGSPEGCVYRSREGLKCIVGWMIPDDKYTPGMDVGGDTGTGVADNELVLTVLREQLDDNLTADRISFLNSLQRVHDGLPSGSDLTVEAFASRLIEGLRGCYTRERLDVIVTRYNTHTGK